MRVVVVVRNTFRIVPPHSPTLPTLPHPPPFDTTLSAMADELEATMWDTATTIDEAFMGREETKENAKEEAMRCAFEKRRKNQRKRRALRLNMVDVPYILWRLEQKEGEEGKKLVIEGAKQAQRVLSGKDDIETLDRFPAWPRMWLERFVLDNQWRGGRGRQLVWLDLWRTAARVYGIPCTPRCASFSADDRHEPLHVFPVDRKCALLRPDTTSAWRDYNFRRWNNGKLYVDAFTGSVIYR